MAAPEKKLLELLNKMPDEQKQMLLDYAEFLFQRYGEDVKSTIPQEPLAIPRPENESVIKALKRLSKTYPTLDTKELFEKTSSFMTRSLMHGEDDFVVIDEMEVFFQQHYQRYIGEKDE